MGPSRNPVLLADDDLAFRQTIRVLLAPDYEVTEVDSCEQTLRLLEQSGGSFDVVLLDVGFGVGRLQGDEVLPTIRGHWPHLEIVMISVEDDVPLAVRCIKMGAFDYVVKGPGMVATLPSKVSQALSVVAVRRENEMLKWELERRIQIERSLAQGRPATAHTRALPSEIVRPFEEVTKDYYLHALRVCGGNMLEAARRLQVPYGSYRQRLIAWNLVAPGMRKV